MKTIKKALSAGFCLTLICLGTSQANDKTFKNSSNDIKNIMIEKEESIMKTPSKQSQAINNQPLVSVVKNTIAGKFNYMVKPQNTDLKFTHLSAGKAFENKDLFSDDMTYDEKLKKLKQMQDMTKYIAQEYRRNFSLIEEIVLTAVVEAEKENLDPALVLSLISVESTFRPQAKSNAGALGLTQVIPKWHLEKVERIGSAKDLHTIPGGIKVGVEVLKEYLSLSKGNIRSALQRYNGSFGDKTYKYSNLVLNKHKVYQKILNS